MSSISTRCQLIGVCVPPLCWSSPLKFNNRLVRFRFLTGCMIGLSASVRTVVKRVSRLMKHISWCSCHAWFTRRIHFSRYVEGYLHHRAYTNIISPPDLASASRRYCTRRTSLSTQARLRQGKDVVVQPSSVLSLCIAHIMYLVLAVFSACNVIISFLIIAWYKNE